MAYPFWLVKWLARTGLANWLPAARRGFDANYLHHYSDRVLATPQEALAEALALSEPAGPEVIDLAAATPLFDLLPSASTRLPADRRGPPPAGGLPELHAAIADKLAADFERSFQPGEETLVTPGVSGAFDLALDAFVNPGDPVVLFDPSCPLYSLALAQRGARVRWVPTWLEDGQVCFHLEPLVRALRGAKLIVINTPNNPTGGILGPEALEAIAWWANRHDALIFSDEVLERYHYEGRRTSMAEVAERRTLIAGSVSKGHGLSSARIGWLAGPRPLLRACALTAAVQGVTVPTLCQQLAATALRQAEERFHPIRDEYAVRLGYAFDRLTALGLQPDWPGGGLSFWVPIGIYGLTGRQFASQLFAEHQVVVWPGECFGPNGSQHIRVSFAGDEGRLRQGLARLGDFIGQLQARLDEWSMRREAWSAKRKAPGTHRNASYPVVTNANAAPR